jgi:hypothetical protein
VAEDWVPRYRRYALVTALAAAFIDGFAESLGRASQVLSILTFASAVTLWCGLDARVHRKLYLRSFGWLMMFTWPIGVLVHLIWTRGWRGLRTYFALAIASIIAAGAGFFLARLIAAR